MSDRNQPATGSIWDDEHELDRHAPLLTTATDEHGQEWTKFDTKWVKMGLPNPHPDEKITEGQFIIRRWGAGDNTQ